MNKTVDYILEVAKCGGITKAANNLYITPSALSKFVQTKEEELKVKLFNRIGKKFVLTYAGERYVEMLQQMMHLKQQMDNEMSRISSMYLGRLRIGFQLSLAETIITCIIPELQKEYPNIQIMIEEGNSTELLNMLNNNQLDIAVTVVYAEPEGINCTVLTEGELILAVPRQSPLHEAAVEKSGFSYPWINLEDCMGQRIILLSPGQIFRKYSDQIFQNQERNSQLDILVKTTRTALLCVANQMGITVNVDILVKQQRFENRVGMLSFGDKPMIHKLAVLSARNSMLTDEIQTFEYICKRFL
ncbi:LysR family transcriptional regulator [Lacrimispora sp. 38-1]|uniref:LysR substrate-binding domain-containing protein n=1 Tax=Lacrimispora sp. 38-1 TaxID=3125778 RepID=UPI003CF706FD